jgi:uncharacterized protein YmfQ (DUF2313 family)
MSNLFKTHTPEEHRKSLADYLPNGNFFNGKNVPTTNIFKLLLGLAYEFWRIESKLNEITEEYYIFQTTELINEWESAVGIPDDCFNANQTLSVRIQQVVAKLALSIDTAQSFIDLAALFGYECEIYSGADFGIYPLPYPWTYYASGTIARFTLIVYLSASVAPGVYPFPNLYPWPYTSNTTNLIECLFRAIKPANCDIIFEYVL